jgi:hypothetical protein
MPNTKLNRVDALLPLPFPYFRRRTARVRPETQDPARRQRKDETRLGRAVWAPRAIGRTRIWTTSAAVTIELRRWVCAEPKRKPCACETWRNSPRISGHSGTGLTSAHEILSLAPEALSGTVPGGVRRALDDYREARRDLCLTMPSKFARELWQDLRFAPRVHRQQPLTVALALAIGTSTPVFSVLSALLRELPFRDPERLVHVTMFSGRRRDACRDRHRSRPDRNVARGPSGSGDSIRI